MNNDSFSNGSAVSFDLKTPVTAYDEAYDNTMNFNRYIKRDDNPYNRIYSIDSKMFLRKLSQDNIEHIKKISLVARVDRTGGGGGFALWDVIFDQAAKIDVNACVFIADSNFRSLDLRRVITKTNYRDRNHSTFRSHLNRVEAGDYVGIGIFDARSVITYVLIYQVDGSCYIRNKSELDSDNRPVSLPGFNCSLASAYRLDEMGAGTSISYMDDDDLVEASKPFVAHLADCAMETSEAFPWKPHFVPTTLGTISFEEIVEGFNTVNGTELNRWEDVDRLCRNIYEDLGHDERQRYKEFSSTRPDTSKKGKSGAAFNYKLPSVNVYYCGDLIYVQTATGVMSFHKSTMGTVESVETFLSFSDVDFDSVDPGKDISVFEMEYGEKVYFRRLFLNY